MNLRQFAELPTATGSHPESQIQSKIHEDLNWVILKFH